MNLKSLHLSNITAAAFCAAVLLVSAGCGSGTSSAQSGASSAEPAAVSSAAPADIELSSGTYPVGTEEITAVLTGEDISKLYNFTSLRYLNAAGSTCTDDLAVWALSNPGVTVVFDVDTPSGSLSTAETSLNLTDLSHADAGAWASVLPLFRSLQTVNLGSNTDGSRDLTLDDIAAMEAAAPQAVFQYTLTAYDQEISLSDTELNLNHITIEDNGDYVRQLLNVMPQCTVLDMDTCGVDDEHMAAIRDDYPNVEVIWRVWFGDDYSVRTNVDKILASKPSVGGALTVENTQSLKYCTKVKYLDVGHNLLLQDVSYLAYMPDLEVCIIAMISEDCDPVDLSPISGCTNLEYLELQSNVINDLSPLSTLVNLHHLNIGNLPDVTDISPLYGLTQLERLWITAYTPIPAEQVAEMQSIVPDCEINTTSPDPTEEGWRYVGTYKDDDEVPHWVKAERYYQLCEQFGYETLDGGYSFSSNDPYYDGTPSQEELDAIAAQNEKYRQTREEVYKHDREMIGLSS